MFTKISKVLLWIMVIGGVITSFAVGSNDRMGWFIPVGLIATLLILAGIGVVVEMADNILRSREILEEISRKMGSSYAPQGVSDNAPQAQSGSSYGSQAQVSGAISRLSAIANGASADAVPDFGYCKQCGEKNDRLASICKGCGKYK